jgi:carbon storage regulator
MGMEIPGRPELARDRSFPSGAVGLQDEGAEGMLVLSRQRDESIIIGDNIVLTVVDIRGDKVRLGIEAPKEVPVHRQEVYDAIHLNCARIGPNTVIPE